MHFILFTRENLHKWGIVASGMCVFCHEDIETIPHNMTECEVIKIIWTNIYNWLYSKTEINYTANPKETIFGIDDPDLTIFNLVYILTQKYIFECSQNRNFPNIQDFDLYLQEIRKNKAKHNKKKY